MAVLLGLLLGLERERSRQPDEGLFAGVRTFPLLALGGYVAAAGSVWVLSALLLGVGGLVITAYRRDASAHAGATTEVAALLAILLGALVAWGHPALAASLAVVVTLLLTLKAPLHRVAGAISQDEVYAILKFGLVTVVLLPLLSTTPMGPYRALVPRHVGIVVATLSAVSLTGYLLGRVLGSRAGWPLAGLLGGLVSSTAVTLSFAGKARAEPRVARALGAGIVLACTVLYGRALFILVLFDRTLAGHLTAPLLALLLLGVVLAALTFRRLEDAPAGRVGLGNPVELSRAVGLGLVFAAILVLARAAEAELGRLGILATAALGGLIDVDAVALTAARLRREGVVGTDLAGKAFLVATLANAALKGTLAAAVGGRALGCLVLPPVLAWIALTVVLLALP